MVSNRGGRRWWRPLFVLTLVVAGGAVACAWPASPPEHTGTGAGIFRAPSDRLTVAPEDVTAPYTRDDWGEWQQDQVGGCDMREAVLARSVTHPDAVWKGAGCKILSGEWLSPYDSVVLESPRQVQIDHIVPVHEAFQSGAKNWTAEQRRTFYNDTDVSVPVSARSNQAKSDRDPAEWKPPNVDYWCAYATSWVNVKVRYGLTADEAEMGALREMLARCPR